MVYAPGLRVADMTPNDEDLPGSEISEEYPPEICDAVDANVNLIVAAPRMKALLVKAMAYESEAFATDGEVDGADLVDFFARWRQEAHALLGDVCKPSEAK